MGAARWAPEEDARLVEMLKDGWIIERIGKELGFSKQRVETRMARLRVNSRGNPHEGHLTGVTSKHLLRNRLRQS